MRRKTSAKVIIGTNISIILMQSLVLLRIIPHQWINGGRVDNYDQAAVVSVVSVLIFSIMSVYIFYNWIYKQSIKPSRMKRNKVGFAIFFGVSFVMQLAGTNFERYVMSIVCLIPLVALILWKEEE